MVVVTANHRVGVEGYAELDGAPARSVSPSVPPPPTTPTAVLGSGAVRDVIAANGPGNTAARTDPPITELRARVDSDGGVHALRDIAVCSTPPIS